MIAAPRKKIPLVSVSPNAVKGSFRVYYPRTGFSGPLRAHLIGSDGSMLDVPIYVQMTNGGEVDITISNPNSGIYYLRIMDGKTSVLKKIIVQ
jgi:hypothetical protein